MGVQKKTRKFAQVKRVISQKDSRLKKNVVAAEQAATKKKDDLIREVYVSCLVLTHNLTISVLKCHHRSSSNTIPLSNHPTPFSWTQISFL